MAAIAARRGETVKPSSTVRLMQAIGTSRASRALGVSATTLHKARKLGQVSRVIEVAAEGALRGVPVQPEPPTRITPVSPKEGTVVYLLEVSASKSEVVEKLAEALDATLISA